jgi:hypothetical protein
LWLGDRDRALLAIASFIIRHLTRQAHNQAVVNVENERGPLVFLQKGTASFDLDKVEFKRRQDASLASRGDQSAELR